MSSTLSDRRELVEIVTGFDDLHPVVQHHVVNSLGWRALRPLQEAAIEPILDGADVLALAPTAGGKTEAAVLPLLSRILTERTTGLSVLYVCPLRALLNNLHERLERYGNWCGVRVGLWHGDVGSGPRREMREEPPEILLTTPESLEAMLLSTRHEHRAFFADVRTVVVDEVHAFAGDDRGWHLLAVLERLTVLAGRDLQRIGLSATVGEPDALLDWLAGSRNAPREVVAPPVAGEVPVAVTLDHVGSVSNAAVVISKLHRGEKRLVFCDSRARVEELASKLRAQEVTTFVSHSSLSLDERRRAEEAFSNATDCVIVSTSTLELGIDVGDLDRVIQLDSPNTVASFLQRLGRTGRRPGATRNMLLLTTGNGLECAKAAGLLHLWSTGFVEPVTPPLKPWHLLAQQLLALVLQEGRVGCNLWPEVIGRLPIFKEAIDSGVAERIVEHLVEQGFLFDDNGWLSVGPEAEQSYGYRHFIELTSTFTAPPLFVARHGANTIGHLDPSTLLTNDRSFARVLLAGRTWQITSIDWKRRFAWLEPAEGAGRSRWVGSGLPWSAELCDAIRTVVCGTDPAGVVLTQRAEDKLADTRAELAWAQEGKTTVVHDESPTRWWTWAGQRANATLAAALGDLASSNGVDNLWIQLDPATGTTAAVAEQLRSVDPSSLPIPPIVADLADDLKFADCLPGDVACEVARSRFVDDEAVARVINALGDQ